MMMMMLWFRTELLKLLLTCFSEAMYLPPPSEPRHLNPWVSFFCSSDNRYLLRSSFSSSPSYCSFF